MKPIILHRSVECRSDAAALWPFLADTNRLNRACCRSPITLKPFGDKSAARYLVQTEDSGFALEYEERPYEWIEHERYAIERRIRKGPLKTYEFSLKLEKLKDGGCRVTFGLRLEPRWFFVPPIARMQGKRNLKKFCEIVAEVDANLQKGQPALVERTHETEQAALAAATETTAGEVAAEHLPLVKRLAKFIAEGSDHELDRIRPFELADDWKVDRSGLLSVFLCGVGGGLVEMSWDLVCPSCRTTSERLPTLSVIPEKAHCQLCDLSFGLDLDRSVEATFRPARGVRRIDDAAYCSGGPSRTPHVVAQKILPPQGEAEFQAPAEPGRYRLFARGGAVASIEVQKGAAKSVSAVAADQFEPARLEVAPGGTIKVTRPSGDERHIKLERVEWANRAATAYHLSMNPTFRRRFSGEVLKPGLMLRVTRVALLFSDLTASTALYTRAGDATAFRLVSDHFEVLGKTVEKHGGTIVKTIGDSIMASFMDEASAVRAAMDMQKDFVAFAKGREQAVGVELKVGVFAGPCYAVTANGILDYFGQTANIAARLQGEAGPGETVLDEDTAGRAEREGWLNGAKVAERFSASLKGLDAPIRAARVVPKR